MNAILGCNVNPSGADKASDLLAAGARHIRLPLWPELDMRMIVMGYQARGIDVLCCMDSKSYSVSNDPRRQAEHWRGVVGDLVKIIQVGSNEFDQVGSTSSTASEAEVFEQLKAARKVFPLHTLVGPNLASGQPERWTKRLDDLVDVIALSRYPAMVLQMADGIFGPFGYLRHNTPRKPIWFGEFPIWGTGDHYVASALRLSQRAYVYNWQSWHQDAERFWHDGLIGLDGKPSWRMDVFKKFALEGGMAVDPGVADDIKLLKQQQALTIEGMRRIAQGRITGADGVAAIIDAVDPEHAGQWTPVPLPNR